ncbi:MAG: caspase family protein [Deltaproteobacteria bacterium]|nr:caspase family protein [Deltaproteobacteria bacterium]
MRRALCVGIDEYAGGPLLGCVSDAERIAAVLANDYDGSPNFDCHVLTAPVGGGLNVITRTALRQAIESLFRDKADVVLLHFSGHGTVNNLDGYIVSQDAKKYDEGVAMGDILKWANDSSAGEVSIFLDCCFSGALGNLPAVDNTKALLREGVSILTASRGDQPSVETGDGGLFTSLLVDALGGGAADVLGAVTVPSVYAYVEAALGAWDQRPLFKSHVSRLVPLRLCAPPVDRATMRRLPRLFPLPAEDLPLDPGYESTSPTANPAKTAVFKDLQALSRVHLVEPCDAPHMYDAAMRSKACRLTPSGRYYWRLATNNRI